MTTKTNTQAKHTKREESEANARLISAAPEMLEALKQVNPMASSLMDELGNRKAANWGLVNDCLVAVHKAISKAEGNNLPNVPSEEG